jgi:hypothetical protein
MANGHCRNTLRVLGFCKMDHKHTSRHVLLCLQVLESNASKTLIFGLATGCSRFSAVPWVSAYPVHAALLRIQKGSWAVPGVLVCCCHYDNASQLANCVKGANLGVAVYRACATVLCREAASQSVLHLYVTGKRTMACDRDYAEVAMTSSDVSSRVSLDSCMISADRPVAQCTA